MSHWAERYIGKEWAADGEGPEEFSCWGLVRAVFRAHYGVEFPQVVVGPALDPETLRNVAVIKQAARVSGMKPSRAPLPPEDGDIVLMSNVVQLHCGIVVQANGTAGVLHSASRIGVVFQPWRDAVAGMNVELWRRER